MFRSAVFSFVLIFLILQYSTSKGEAQQFLNSSLSPSTNNSGPSSQVPVIPSTVNIDNICDNSLWKIACSVYERTSSSELLVSYSMYCFSSSSFSYSATTLNAICESINGAANFYNNYLWITACAVYNETSASQLLVSHTMASFQLSSFSYNSATLNAICDWNRGSRVTNVNICDTTWTTACGIYQRTSDSRPLVSYAMKAFNLGSFSYNDNTLDMMCESGISEVSNESCHNSWKAACKIYDLSNNSPLVSHIMSSYQITSFSYNDSVLKTICNSIIETISSKASISVKSLTFSSLIIIIIIIIISLLRNY